MTSTSDQRLKTDIRTLENALERLLDLRGVSFRWDTSNPKVQDTDYGTQLGLVAQEVETRFPELVRDNSDGYKSISYGKLSAVLVEAVKEQQEMIDQQQEMILMQHSLMEDLYKRLEILESK